jgi:hypothetical protein
MAPKTVAVRILWSGPVYVGGKLTNGEYIVWFNGKKTTVSPPSPTSRIEIIKLAMRKLGYKCTFTLVESNGTDGDCSARVILNRV